MDVSPRAIAATRERARTHFRGPLQPILADFYQLELQGKFDVVSYFDGFGVGKDEDQRRLLRRVAGWLELRGSALVEVYTPWYWAAAAGMEMQFLDAWRRYGFDAAGERMLDTWWPKGRPEEAVTQSLRCYGPADLHLLLDGTGLVLASVEPGGAVDQETGEYRSPVELGKAMSYLATLRLASSPAA